MVFDSNTIVNPRAVMIKSLNTSVTYSTMSASSWFDNLTFGAEINWIDISQKFHKILSITWLKFSWISATCIHKGHEYKQSWRNIYNLWNVNHPVVQSRQNNNHVDDMNDSEHSQEQGLGTVVFVNWSHWNSCHQTFGVFLFLQNGF